MTSSSQPILITALRPKGWVRKRLDGWANIALLDKIRGEFGDRYHYAPLPLSSVGEIELYRLLHKHQPAGVVSLGNIFWQTHVTIEPHAVSAPLFARNGEVVTSEFARSYLSRQNNMEKSTIGRRYENRIYLGSLTWACNHRDEPVVFLRIPQLGQRRHHYAEVVSILQTMEQAINAGSSD